MSTHCRDSRTYVFATTSGPFGPPEPSGSPLSVFREMSTHCRDSRTYASATTSGPFGPPEPSGSPTEFLNSHVVSYSGNLLFMFFPLAYFYFNCAYRRLLVSVIALFSWLPSLHSFLFNSSVNLTKITFVALFPVSLFSIHNFNKYIILILFFSVVCHAYSPFCFLEFIPKLMRYGFLIILCGSVCHAWQIVLDICLCIILLFFCVMVCFVVFVSLDCVHLIFHIFFGIPFRCEIMNLALKLTAYESKSQSLATTTDSYFKTESYEDLEDNVKRKQGKKKDLARKEYKTVSRIRTFYLQPDDLVFTSLAELGLEEDPEFDTIPEGLLSVKVSDIPALLNSLFQCRDIDSRAIAAFRRSWSSDHDHYVAVKKFIFEQRKHIFQNSFTSSYNSAIVPDKCEYIADNRMFMPSIPLIKFQSSETKRGVCAPLVYRCCSIQDNFLAPLLEAPVRSLFIPPSRVKAIVRSLSDKKESQANIIQFFMNRCPYVKKFDKASIRDLSWTVTYINPEWYYLSYDPDGEDEVKDVFCSLVNDLRENIINFVRHYLDLGKLTPHDRDKYFKEQSLAIADVLRSPESQAMFVTGVSKDVICDKIFKEKLQGIQKKANKGVIMVSQRKKISRSNDRKRAAERFDKTYDQFHVHPDFIYDVDVPVTVNVPSVKQIEQPITVDVEGVIFEISSPSSALLGAQIQPQSNCRKVVRFRIVSGGFKEYVESNNIVSPEHDYFVPQSNVLPLDYLNTFCLVLMVSALYYSYQRAVASSRQAILDVSQVLIPKVDSVVNAVDNFCGTISATGTTVVDVSKPIVSVLNLKEPGSKVILLEIKTLIHVLYSIYINDHISLAAWASNFLVTRGIELTDIFLGLNFSAFRTSVHKNPTINYNGRIYVVPVEYYTLVVNAWGTNEYERYLLTYGVVQVQPESFDFALDVLSKLLVRMKISDMDDRDISAANNQFRFIDYCRRDISDTTKGLFKILCGVTRLLFNYDPFDEGFNDYVKSLNDLTTTISNYSVMGDDIACKKDTLNAVIALHKDAIQVVNNPRLDTVTPSLKQLVMREFASLERIAARASQLIKGARPRCEPLFLLLTGPPHVGKTTTCKYIKAALSYFHGVEYSEEHCYYYSSSTEYWEGYRQQRFVQVDDFLKQRDITVRARECSAVIDMVNTAPYNLNMAFEGKGSNFFDSDYILSSTNVANNGIAKAELHTGLIDENAVRRRFGLVLHREEKFQYGMDIAKCKYRIDTCVLAPDLHGKWISVEDIPPLMFTLKRRSDSLLAEFKFTREYFSAKYDPNVVIDPTHYGNEGISAHDTIESSSSAELPVSSDAPVDSNFGEEKHFETNSKSGYFSDLYGSASSTITSLASDSYSYLVDIYKKMDKHTMASYIVPTLSMVVGLVGAYNIYSFYSSNGVSVNYSAPNSKDMKVAGSNKQRVKSPWKNYAMIKRMGGSRMKPEASTDNYLDCLLNKISQSVIYCRGSSTTSTQTAQAVHIKDRLVLVPVHFFSPIDRGEDRTLVLTYGGENYTIPWPEDPVQMENEDMLFFMLPNNVPIPKACYPYIISETDPVDMQVGSPVDIVTKRSDGCPIVKPCTKGHTNRNPVQYIIENGHTFTINMPISYLGATESGDSGAIVCSQGKQGRPCIIGMHAGKQVSGRDAVGVAIPICKEMFEAVFDYFKPISSTVDAPVKVITESFKVEDFPLTVLERVPESEAHHLPTKSKIRRSSLYGCFGEAIKRPAILQSQPGQPNVLFKAISKMHQEKTPAYPFDKERLMAFLQHTYPRSDVGGSKPGPISYTEALSGDLKKGSQPICYSTSAGYGYSKGKKGKSDYLVLKPDGSYDYTEEFMAELLQYEEQLLSGQQIPCLWADFLKDEVRLHEKVNDFKTRLISGCQIHFLILMRRYFQDMISHTYAHCVDKPIATGINVHSMDHTLLFYRLNQTSHSVIAGDFSNFDGKLPSYIGEVIIEFINWWYDDGIENARVRNLLAQHIFTPKHIVYDIIYQVVDGNPSGNPITTLYNSLCNLAMCYIILHEDLKVPDGLYNITVYGDDNVITVADYNADHSRLRVSDFTPHFARRFDLAYTHFSKSKDCLDDYDTLLTIKYLGRRFVKENSVYRAPLDLDIIMQSLYWYNGDILEESVMLDTIRAAFLELSHHGCDVFTECCKTILSAIRKRLPRLYPGALEIYATKSYYYYVDSMYWREEGSIFKNTLTDAIDPTTLSDLDFPNLEFKTESRNYSKASNGEFYPETVTATDGSNFSDRHVNDPIPTQHVQLGSYMDAAQVDPSAVDSQIIEPMHKECNMETFSLDNIMQREYEIFSTTWDGSQGPNTLLGTVDHPGSLFAVPFVQEKIKNFAYFRGGMRVSVRIVCNKFCYGKLGLFFKPFPLQDPYSALEQSNLQRHSGDPHILISASAGETGVFDVPFISAVRALDIESLTPLGTFYLKVFNPLISCTPSIPEAQVFVTAQFIETELFLPSNFVPQSKQEAIVKSKTGVISSALEKMDTVASYVENVPFVGSYANQFRSVSKPLTSIAKALGLSKPTTVATAQVMKVNPFSDMANGKGLDLTMKLAMDPENRVSCSPSIGGVTYDEMDLVALAGTPKLFEQIKLNKGDTWAFNVFNIQGLDPVTEPYMGYFDFVANNFTHYSGSIKVKAYFTASVMQTARIVVWLARGFQEDWMQCYHQVVDVTGDTEYSVTLPYPEDDVVWRVNNTCPWTLNMRVIGWSQPDPGLDNPIWVNLYRAAADDIRFYGQKERRYIFVTESNPRADFSKPFPTIHPSIKTYVPQNIVFGETHTHLKEMLHKYYPYKDIPANTNVQVYNLLSNSSGYTLGIEMLCLPFAFRSGSVRHKFLLRKNSYGLAASLNMLNHLGEQFIGTSVTSTINPLAEAEIPFYKPYAFVMSRVGPTEGDALYTIVSGGGQTFLFKSVGDDFAAHFLCAWPPGYFSSVVNPDGYAALRTFFTV